MIDLTPEQTATVLAALRYYQEHDQGNPDSRTDAIHEIATDSGTLVSLDGEAIDQVCTTIKGADEQAPFTLLRTLGFLLGIHVSEAGMWTVGDVINLASDQFDVTINDDQALSILRMIDSDYLRDLFYENIVAQLEERFAR